MTRADLAILDLDLHGGQPMTSAKARGWIVRLRDELVNAQQGAGSLIRVLAMLKRLVEDPEAKAIAVRLLQEYGVTPLPPKPEVPLDQKRKEFMEVWKAAKPAERVKLEEAIQAAGDEVLLKKVGEAKA